MSHQTASMVTADGIAAAFFGCAKQQDIDDLVAAILHRPSEYAPGQTDDTAAAYQDAATVTFTPLIPGTRTWDIGFRALTRNAASFGAYTRVTIDGTPYSEGFTEDGGQWIPVCGGAHVDLDASEHTVVVQIKSNTAAQTASCKEISIKAELVKL